MASGSCAGTRLPRPALDDQLCITTHVSRDNRQSARHRLENGVRDTLRARRQREDVEGTHYLRDVATLACEPHDVADARRTDLRLDIGALGSVADHGQTEMAALASATACNGNRANQIDLILHRLQAPDRSNDDRFGVVERTVPGGLALLRGTKTRDVNAVADAFDTPRCNTDAIDEIRLDLARQGHVAVDEGAKRLRRNTWYLRSKPQGRMYPNRARHGYTRAPPQDVQEPCTPALPDCACAVSPDASPETVGRASGRA